MNNPAPSQLSVDERVVLGAADGIYFGHEFFPRVLRQESPDFHYEMMGDIESLEHQFVAWEVFRGGAKTTLMRIALAKRVSYCLTRVSVFTSAAQRHAERTVRWLKRQIEVNAYWTQTFGLRKGAKWTDNEIEIYNGLLQQHIFILAIGMTGQTRGINIDDYRPDFWVNDDVCNEENTGSEDQRKKSDELFFGAMQGSLASLEENPHSKMCAAQTSLHRDDIINKCHRDPTWQTRKYGILNEQNQSRWPALFPTERVLAEKAAYISRGQKYIWDREKECKITPREGKAFMMDNVQFYDVLPTSMVVYIGIDPAREKHLNPKKAHKAAIVCVGAATDGMFLLDFFAQKQQNPEQLWTEFYRMALRWGPRLTGVETIAYQQTLAWYFRQKMIALNHFFVIREIEDRRRKADRIRQAHAGLIQERRFFLGRGHTEYYSALDDYSDEVDIDLLDAGAIAITLSSPTLLMLSSKNTDDEDEFDILIQQGEKSYPDLPAIEHCP
jgi:hypothetical protein